jgi:hypothetical protein
MRVNARARKQQYGEESTRARFYATSTEPKQGELASGSKIDPVVMVDRQLLRVAVDRHHVVPVAANDPTTRLCTGVS